MAPQYGSRADVTTSMMMTTVVSWLGGGPRMCCPSTMAIYLFLALVDLDSFY